MSDFQRRVLRSLLKSDWQPSEDFNTWPEPADTFDNVLDAAWHEAAASLDPSATNAALLEVRIQGEAFGGGQLAFERAEALFPLLRKEVEAASSKPEHAKLAIAGIGRGSVVLNLRPVDPVFGEHEDSLGLPVSGVDPAVRMVIRLHSRFSDPQLTANELAAQYPSQLLGAAARLIRTLTDWDAHLSMAWRPVVGNVVRSQLSRESQDRALTFFEEETTTTPDIVQGQIVEMSLAGHITVKPSIKGARRQVQVDGDRLRELRLGLGDQVVIHVSKTVERDKVGRELSERLEFVRLGTEQDHGPYLS